MKVIKGRPGYEARGRYMYQTHVHVAEHMFILPPGLAAGVSESTTEAQAHCGHAWSLHQ